jgi:hypothetical protein
METVCSVCTHVKLESKPGISFQKLLTALRRRFRQQGFGLRIKSQRDKFLDSEEFYVNAYYDPEDDYEGDIPIEVVVHHNFDKDTVWDQKHATEFLVQIFDAVVHEYKHQRQSIKRNYRTYVEHTRSPYNQYLADPDEVDAYAISIAIELCRNIGKYRALKYMGKISSLSRLKFNGKLVSPCLASYFGSFGNLPNPVLKRLIKKIYIRLQKIDTDALFV